MIWQSYEGPDWKASLLKKNDVNNLLLHFKLLLYFFTFAERLMYEFLKRGECIFLFKIVIFIKQNFD